jgi:hypothetical protein
MESGNPLSDSRSGRLPFLYMTTLPLRNVPTTSYGSHN